VAKSKNPHDLSIEELRWLMVEKRRALKQDRLERYRRSGRAMLITPDEGAAMQETLRTTQIESIDLDDGSGMPTPRSRQRRFFDGFLLLIEITAVLGFLFIVFNGLNVLRALNSEVAQALEQSTMTPTPLVFAVVLPSGHTPPNAAGGARPNDAEIPEHLRPLVQSLALAPVPTPGPQQAIRIKIPAIKLDAPVVQGDGWEQLKKGVGQHNGTPDPGQRGNIILSAHNDIFGEIFRNLDQLKAGDEIVLFTNQNAYSYLITRNQVVEPTQVEVMAQTTGPTVTLISCYPYLVDNKRIVITAQLKGAGN
jgi:sortase A